MTKEELGLLVQKVKEVPNLREFARYLAKKNNKNFNTMLSMLSNCRRTGNITSENNKKMLVREFSKKSKLFNNK